ncbi:MAG: hypothetical protein KJ775_16555 [Alphaproteobacteria bacterium]|nr:hypothetical protein [Alphaproteobacteria bacterium]MBU2095528.1 hypothetical protein [Alphaproteobacteria bacterium]MBU2307034.1 hypothetical protein [Alphaproteobacteria bacterium]
MAVAVAALSLAVLAAGRTLAAPPERSIDEIAHVYHGVAVDKDLKPIKLDQAAVLEMLDSVVAKAGTPAAEPDLKFLREAQGALTKKKALSPSAAFVLKGAMVDQVLRAAPTAVQETYGWKVEYLRARARGLGFKPEAAEADVSKALGFSPLSLRLQTETGRWLNKLAAPSQTYAASCQAEGVPLPPNWTSGKWVLQGVLPQEFNFLELGLEVEVYAYADPNAPGACIALPRWDDAAKTKVTLGVICQSATTGKACFWDNRPHNGEGEPFTAAELATTDIQRDWVNGSDPDLIGGGKCVMCHRGENVFIIHPKTPLQVRPPFVTKFKGWYTPVNTLGWTNPPATTLPNTDGEACDTCHEIASTTDPESASYCVILSKAAVKEMPSRDGPAGWPTPSADYLAHINALKANCPGA